MMRRRIAGTQFPFARVLLDALAVADAFAVSMVPVSLPAGYTPFVKKPTPANHTECPSANLSGSDINLHDTDLRFANLEGANLSGSNLEAANLFNAKLAASTCKAPTCLTPTYVSPT